MFFTQDDRDTMRAMRNQMKVLAEHVEVLHGTINEKFMFEGSRTTKVDDNMKKLNDMALELKGVVSMARSCSIECTERAKDFPDKMAKLFSTLEKNVQEIKSLQKNYKVLKECMLKFMESFEESDDE